MAASYGSALFKGRSGRTYYKDIYADDTANNPIRWDNGGGASATSETSWISPEDCVLLDFCLTAATGQTKTSLQGNGMQTGDIFRNALHLSTVTFRPTLMVPFRAGTKVSMVQLA